MVCHIKVSPATKSYKKKEGCVLIQCCSNSIFLLKCDLNQLCFSQCEQHRPTSNVVLNWIRLRFSHITIVRCWQKLATRVTMTSVNMEKQIMLIYIASVTIRHFPEPQGPTTNSGKEKPPFNKWKSLTGLGLCRGTILLRDSWVDIYNV